MRHRGVFLTSAMLLAVLLASGCNSSKPAIQAAIKPPTLPGMNIFAKTSDTTGAQDAELAAAQADSVQLAFRQEAEGYQSQVAQDIFRAAMRHGTDMVVDGALQRTGMNNPVAKMVVKSAINDLQNRAMTSDTKAEQPAQTLEITAVLGHAKANNARLDQMIGAVNILVGQRKKDTARIKIASDEEKQRHALRLAADEALLAVALAASEQELAKIEMAGKANANSGDLVVEIEATRQRGQQIKQAMMLLKTMKSLAN
jgi:hypothetical protein